MLKVSKSTQENLTKYNLAGTVDEATDFRAVLGKLPAQSIFNCKEITRINSMGVKNWIQFFTEAKKANTNITFEELSPPLVESLNMIQNFLGGHNLSSLVAPFLCSACQTRFFQTFTIESIKNNKQSFPAAPCIKCKKPAEFDDLPEEFLSFLG